jgi:TolB-like protein/Tfp pilus assembly protein PilF
MTNLFSELRRRNVFRVGLAYLIGTWLVVQVADTVLNNIGAPAWVIQAIMLVLALGFLFAVFFAWAFEVTPEGLKREAEVDRSRSITRVTGRKLDRAITVLLVIALGYFVWESRIADRQPPSQSAIEAPTVVPSEERISIAVLPFEHRSSREEDEYFTEGIHDDLLTTISKIGSMKVISRTSVMQYRDTTKNMRDIARELGVANILEGGVQRSGNHVRINVQLIDAVTDEHLWAEIYDRELSAENLFAIQSEITQAIAKALQAALSPDDRAKVDKVYTQNLEAYEAYLLGRKRWAAREADSVAEAITHFERAIELDPDFALAWVGLSDALRFMPFYADSDPDVFFPQAERAVTTALRLDDSLPEAYAARGSLRAQQGDDQAGVEDLRRAIELSPNFAEAYNWLGISLDDLGRYEEALAVYRRGLELDPLARAMRSNLALLYDRLGRHDEAREELARLDQTNPDWSRRYFDHTRHTALVDNRWDESARWASRFLEATAGSAEGPAIMAYIYSVLDDLETAGKWLDFGAERGSDSTIILQNRQYYLMLKGNVEEARRAVEAVFEKDPAASRLPILDAWDIEAGRPDAPLQRYTEVFPELLAVDGPKVNRANVLHAADAAYLYGQLGMDAKAQRLLDLAIPYIESMPLLGDVNPGWGNARTFALLGRNTEALAELRRGVDAGWRWDWQYYFDHDPILEPLRSEPGFQDLRAKVAADMAVQLKRVRELEASGDIRRPEDFAEPDGVN